MTRTRTTRIGWAVLIPAFSLCCQWSASNSLRADVIRLTNGGEVRGELLESKSAPQVGLPHPTELPEGEEPIDVRTLNGSIITVAREQIDFVQRRPLKIERYVSKARRTEDTVQGHWDLAEWCGDLRLLDERKEQLEMLLDLDPDHEETRRLLGYVRHNGRWMTRDDMMASRGYVRHKGKWVTTQELELIEKSAAQREAEREWYPKVRLWLAWLVDDRIAQKQEALKSFNGIQDPDAIPALTRLLSDHDDRGVRIVYIHVLSHIPGAAAATGIVNHLLLDSDRSVRQEAAQALPTEQYEHALPLLIQALRHESNEVVARAGTMLGIIGDEAAVPALIDALVTTHRYRIEVPANDGITIGQTADGRLGMMDGQAASNVVPPAVDQLARTGQLPYGYQVNQFPGMPTRTRVVTGTTDVKNPTVLAALEKITGRNLGFNERDWHFWLAVEKG